MIIFFFYVHRLICNIHTFFTSIIHLIGIKYYVLKDNTLCVLLCLLIVKIRVC